MNPRLSGSVGVVERGWQRRERKEWGEEQEMERNQGEARVDWRSLAGQTRGHATPPPLRHATPRPADDFFQVTYPLPLMPYRGRLFSIFSTMG